MKRTRRYRLDASRPVAATLFAGIAAGMLLVACQDSDRATALTAPGSQFTLGSGAQSTLLGRATFPGPFKVKRQTGEWDVEIKAHNAVDIAVQSITFQPGGQSGWHQHPGPVFIQVVSGTMTFYESDDPSCAAIVRTAGQGYLDTGDHAHIARNETASPATNVVTYFAPPGAALRIDAPNPGNCTF